MRSYLVVYFDSTLKHIFLITRGVFQVALVAKNTPASAGELWDVGSIPGSGRSPGGRHGNQLQDSCLEHPMDGGVWQATVHRVTKSQTQLKQLSTYNKGMGWLSPTSSYLFSWLSLISLLPPCSCSNNNFTTLAEKYWCCISMIRNVPLLGTKCQQFSEYHLRRERIRPSNAHLSHFVL